MLVRWGTDQDKVACAKIEDACGLWHDDIDFEAALTIGLEWLVVESQELPGKVIGHTVAVFDRARIWIDTIAVLPSYQRRGVGRLLVQHLLAMDGGREIASTPVPKSLPINVFGFWSRLGFEDRGTQIPLSKLFAKPRQHGFAILMQRGLAPIDEEFDAMIAGKKRTK